MGTHGRSGNCADFRMVAAGNAHCQIKVSGHGMNVRNLRNCLVFCCPQRNPTSVPSILESQMLMSYSFSVRMKFASCIVCLLAVAAFQLPAQTPPAAVYHYADLVLYNGQILTADRDDPNFAVKQAVAI